MMRFVLIMLLFCNVSFGQTFKQDSTFSQYKSHFNFNTFQPHIHSYYNTIYPNVTTTGRVVLSVKNNESFQLMTRIPLNSFYTKDGLRTGLRKFFKHLVLVVPKEI